MDIKDAKEPKKILIVDDEPAITTVLSKFLKKQGYDVICFTNPKKAIGFLKTSYKIDLIITDLKMPEVSGIFIVQAGAKNNIPAIIISSGIGVQVEEGLSDFGYDSAEVFFKPFDLYKLAEAIEKKLALKDKEEKEKK